MGSNKPRGKAKPRRYWTGRTPFDRAMDLFERRFLEAMFRECGGNKTEAARHLGLSYATLKYRLRRLKQAESQPMAPDRGDPETVARVRDQVLGTLPVLDSSVQGPLTERIQEIVRIITEEARRDMAQRILQVVKLE